MGRRCGHLDRNGWVLLFLVRGREAASPAAPRVREGSVVGAVRVTRCSDDAYIPGFAARTCAGPMTGGPVLLLATLVG